MVIRIRKIHICIFAFILVSVSFLITLKSEPIDKTVSSQQGIKLPVVMYHHITENPDKSGKYVVTTAELENDFKYIKEKGYETVLIDDLIKYSKGEIELPDKIIMVTFDDGFKSVYKLALPIIEKYGIKAIVAPVGAVTEEYTQNQNTDINYSYMTWDELKSINNNQLIEVQSHTYNMHKLSKDSKNRNGMAKLNAETDYEYRNVIIDDLTKMQNELYKKSGITPTAIAYPYGLYSKRTLNIIKELGYKSNFLCEEKINIIYKGDENSLYNLGRFNRPSGIDTIDFFKRMKVI